MREKALFIQIFIIAFLVLYSSSLAQNSPIDKGNVIISGHFSFRSQGGDLYENSDGDRYTILEFDPAANFFVSSGFAIGARLLYENWTRGDYNYTIWGMGPEINYFFSGGEEKPEAKGATYPFLQGGFFYTNRSYNAFMGEVTETGIKIRLGVGIAHMISNAVALTGLAAYDIDNEKREEGDSKSGNQFGIYAGLMIFLY